MKYTALTAVILVLAAGAFVQAASVVDLSCEGQESTGGGPRQYYYEVRNTTSQVLYIEAFLIGTDDLNLSNYSNWVDPTYVMGGQTVSWSHSLVAAAAFQTDEVKTPHGQVAPPRTRYTQGYIVWSDGGYRTGVQPGATLKFGFDNPLPSMDVEWMVSSRHDGTAGPYYNDFTNWSAAVAGPVGFFTTGPVHAPAIPEPLTMLSAFLAISSLGVYLRRRTRA